MSGASSESTSPSANRLSSRLFNFAREPNIPDSPIFTRKSVKGCSESALLASQIERIATSCSWVTLSGVNARKASFGFSSPPSSTGIPAPSGFSISLVPGTQSGSLSGLSGLINPSSVSDTTSPRTIPVSSSKKSRTPLAARPKLA